MAVSILDVRGISGNNTTFQLAAFAADPQNGDLIVVAYGQYHASSPLAPTDTAGNTYVQIGTTNVAASTNSQSLWYAKNITGGTNFRVTVNPNGSYCACEAWAITGVGANPYNGDFSKFTPVVSTTDVRSENSTTPPAANSIFLGFGSIGAANVLTDQAGWNTTGLNGFDAGMLSRARIADYASNFDCFGAYKIASSQQEAFWTGASNDTDHVGMVASFGSGAVQSGFPGLFLGI